MVLIKLNQAWSTAFVLNMSRLLFYNVSLYGKKYRKKKYEYHSMKQFPSRTYMNTM